MKLDALDHPKTLDFAARLQVELPTAIGHLELLWAFTGKKAPQGDIGKWPDGAIARACYWMGRPETFILALIESGFLEADPDHRLTVHDWHDHATGWVRAKLKKLGLDFVPIYRERPSEPSSDRSSEGPLPSSVAASERSILAKRSVAKRSEESEARGRARDDSPGQAPEAAPELPPGLDPAAWKRWHDYRREIRKPLKPVSIPAAQRELAAFGADQAAVVEQSIANGWQGLFALKRVNGTARATASPSRQRLMTPEEIEAEESARATG